MTLKMKIKLCWLILWSKNISFTFSTEPIRIKHPAQVIFRGHGNIAHNIECFGEGADVFGTPMTVSWEDRK